MARIDIKLVTGFSPQTQKDFVETTDDTKKRLKDPKPKAEVDTVRIQNSDATETIRFRFDPKEALPLFGKAVAFRDLKPGAFEDFKVVGTGKLGVLTTPARPGHDHTDLHVTC